MKRPNINKILSDLAINDLSKKNSLIDIFDTFYKNSKLYSQNIIDYDKANDKIVDKFLSISENGIVNEENHLKYLRMAGKIHVQIRKDLNEYLKPGLMASDVCDFIENKIKEYTYFDRNNPKLRGIAFPVGISINNCAAHWNPNPGDKTIIKENDVCKIDYGVHIGGHIIDSAFTKTFNSNYTNLLNASKEAVYAAINMMRPGTSFCQIGEEIEDIVKSYSLDLDGKTYNLKPVATLGGHSINRYQIHGDDFIPLVKNIGKGRVKENQSYAVEVFVTTGSGMVIENYNCSHYMLNKSVINGIGNDNTKFNYLNKINNELNTKEKKLLNHILNNHSSLAFCRRWFRDLNYKYQLPLSGLCKKGIINKYPPLYDINNSYISQFEHTIYVNENKTEILSRGTDW